MKPSEIRARVMEDHAGLRVDLDRLEALTQRIRDGGFAKQDVDALRGGAKNLLDKLRAHMRWEEIWLLPVLRNADAWGSERADRLIGDHREQRVLLDFLLDRLLDAARPDRLVFSDVDALVAFLRRDMESEESDLVDERLLRDDVIGIDVETG